MSSFSFVLLSQKRHVSGEISSARTMVPSGVFPNSSGEFVRSLRFPLELHGLHGVALLAQEPDQPLVAGQMGRAHGTEHVLLFGYLAEPFVHRFVALVHQHFVEIVGQGGVGQHFGNHGHVEGQIGEHQAVEAGGHVGGLMQCLAQYFQLVVNRDGVGSLDLVHILFQSVAVHSAVAGLLEEEEVQGERFLLGEVGLLQGTRREKWFHVAEKNSPDAHFGLAQAVEYGEILFGEHFGNRLSLGHHHLFPHDTIVESVEQYLHGEGLAAVEAVPHGAVEGKHAAVLDMDGAIEV